MERKKKLLLRQQRVSNFSKTLDIPGMKNYIRTIDRIFPGSRKVIEPVYRRTLLGFLSTEKLRTLQASAKRSDQLLLTSCMNIFKIKAKTVEDLTEAIEKLGPEIRKARREEYVYSQKPTRENIQKMVEEFYEKNADKIREDRGSQGKEAGERRTPVHREVSLGAKKYSVSSSGPGLRVTIYTDGACSGNPGPGGWGAIISYGKTKRELYDGVGHATNNQMELMAAIMALEAIPKPYDIDLHIDSQYVKNGITQWIHGWKKRGWKTTTGTPVKNADLWKRLDKINKFHRVTWHWVKGHAGNPMNERVDELARKGISEVRGLLNRMTK